MQNTSQDNPLKDKIVLISKFSDDGDRLELSTQNTPWLAQILDKTTEDIITDTPECDKEINVDLTLQRGSDNVFGEYLFVSGKVSANYTATCVRCLIDTDQEINHEFTGAYVNKRFEDDPEYEDVDVIFINDAQADLFFHDRGKADIADIIKEATFLPEAPENLLSSSSKSSVKVSNTS